MSASGWSARPTPGPAAIDFLFTPDVKAHRSSFAVNTRAMSYFAPDWRWITLLIGLIGVSVSVGLLEAWPLAVLIDSVLTATPRPDRIHRIFLSLVPASRTGQI